MKRDIKEYLEKMCVGISFWIVSVVARFYIMDESYIVRVIIGYGIFYSSFLIILATREFIKKIRSNR
jgi:hypothetical protein